MPLHLQVKETKMDSWIEKPKKPILQFFVTHLTATVMEIRTDYTMVRVLDAPYEVSMSFSA